MDDYLGLGYYKETKEIVSHTDCYLQALDSEEANQFFSWKMLQIL